MKRFVLALLLLSLVTLARCNTKQNAAPEKEEEYSSNISADECYLCGNAIEKLIPSYWGQDNIALVSLNTFEIKTMEINRYNRVDRQPIEEYAGFVSFGGGGSIDGGFSSSMMLEHDRGYAVASVNFYSDKTLDVSKTASFLCSNCLNNILPRKTDHCFGVGAIHLGTKDIRLFEENLEGFGLGDFHIDCNFSEERNGDIQRMDLLVFYCPVRYERES